MVAVKTKQQIRTKSNIVLACLASTDLVVGLVVQPMTIAAYTFMLKGDADNYCSLAGISMVIAVKCFVASFTHLLLVSGERFFAIKHTFAHETRVTEDRIIIAAGVAWLPGIIFPVETSFTEGDKVFTNILPGIIMLVIFFVLMFYFNAAVYIEVRRIEKHIVANQVSLEAKTKLLKNKKAFYTTAIVLLVIFFCYLPGQIFMAIIISFKRSIPVIVGNTALFLSGLLPTLNSLFNPLIYAVRVRYFRVAFIQLLLRKTIPQAEQLERNIFGPRQIGVVAAPQQEH